MTPPKPQILTHTKCLLVTGKLLKVINQFVMEHRERPLKQLFWLFLTNIIFRNQQLANIEIRFQKEFNLLYLTDSKRAVIGQFCGQYYTVRPAFRPAKFESLVQHPVIKKILKLT